MNSKKRILISILLVLIILSTNIAATLAATKSELQNKQNNINQQIKDTENEISAVKEEMSDTMKQIQDLNTQISGYQSEIDDLEYKIDDLEKDIEESQEKLNEAEKNYNKQEEAFKNRIVAQYEAGETTYLDVLLGGGSLWDMVSNWYVVSEIADLDNQMLGQMEKNKNEIEEAKKALETNKEQIEVSAYKSPHWITMGSAFVLVYNFMTAKFEYNIAPVAVSGFNDMGDDEYNEVIAREQLDLLIFTSSQISGIYLNETDDQTSSWIRNYTTITLNGAQYYVTRFVQNDLVNIYDPINESPRTVIFTYKITMS